MGPDVTKCKACIECMLAAMQVDYLYGVLNRLGKEAAASAQGGLSSDSISTTSNVTTASQRQDSHSQRAADQLPSV